MQWCAVVQKSSELCKHDAVCPVHALLVCIHAILFSFAHFGNNHAREQAMQSLLLGKLHSMTPYTDDASTMLAKIIGLRMTNDYSVKVFFLIVLAKEQTFV